MRKYWLFNYPVKFAVSLFCLFILGCSKDNPVENEPRDKILKVPSEFPTIQAAIVASQPGDEVVIADGVYSGTGNIDILISQKSVTIRSENGPDYTSIDCRGDSLNQHQAFAIENQISTNTIIEGLTIKNGYFSSGAAVHCKSTAPVFSYCIFQNNVSTVSGGAIRCKSASPKFFNCTFVGNSSRTGGTIFALASSSPTLENCIIAFSDSGQSIAIGDAGSQPLLNCCNVFGNVGGDWPNAISGQLGVNGNISKDPSFCNALINDYHLLPSSPCAPSMNSCGVLIGALPVSCTP